jgi:hypothetical protein
VRPILFSKISQLWRKLLFYMRRDRFDCELEEEMRFHLEMKAEENLAAGVSPEESRYSARRQFGNQTLIRETSRDMWSFGILETLARDLRFGLRMAVWSTVSSAHGGGSEDACGSHTRRDPVD